ncbi:uncharacterized protein MELLADRAFT_111514 [Melampsora larici-populina 98AG31]|uniref:Uncharacterized protein n=1 Tax=Melampsora larici-populina (strain 98AG31 / pathotype 3-4-7) TaxID=747676 RepID=F4S3F7_MELLP|nr:uncharacterized protein MELLADRAFT_111514 [Melampsora larici-populina 98AG31]EGG00842.1 hypothetical protein MELLADRAFT_111514 [Melampsora larici-populina 98AG31]
MAPRKSSRVKDLEETVGRPNYSDSIRRSNSVGSQPRRPHGFRPPSRASTTGLASGAGQSSGTTDHEAARPQLPELAQRSDLEPQQHPQYHDLSEIVEVNSRDLGDLDGGRVQESDEHAVGSIRGGAEVASENPQRLHRTGPACQTNTSPSGASILNGRTLENPNPTFEQRPVPETSSSRGRSPQHATNVVIQPSVLPSHERHQGLEEQGQESPKATSGEPQGTPTMSNTVLMTPSPFLSSHRIISEVVPPKLVVPVFTVPTRLNRRTNALEMRPKTMTEPKSVSLSENMREIEPFHAKTHAPAEAKKTEHVRKLEDTGIADAKTRASPFVLPGLLRNTSHDLSPISQDKNFSLSEKFKKLRLQTESLSAESIHSWKDHQEDLDTRFATMQKIMEEKFNEGISKLNEKWDFCLNILNDEMSVNFEDIKETIIMFKCSCADVGAAWTKHQDEIERLLINQVVTNQQLIETHSHHLGELMCRLGEKFDEQAQMNLATNRNVSRIVSMLDKSTAKKDSEEQLPEPNGVFDKGPSLSNNPFAHELVTNHRRTMEGYDRDTTLPVQANNASPDADIRKAVGARSWPEWREIIKEHFGTPLWKRKMSTAFDRDVFSWEHKDKPVAWLLLQRRRMEAAWPTLSVREQIDKILGLCDGDIEHAVQSRIREYSDFEAFVNIFEDVVTHTSIGRRFKKAENIKQVQLGNSKFRDYKNYSNKEYRNRDYRGGKDGKPENGEGKKPPFKTKDGKKFSFEKKINAVDAEPQISDEGELQGSRSQDSESTTEEEDVDFCVGNVDMFRIAEDLNISETESHTGNTLDVENTLTESAGITLQQLATNLRISENAISTAPPIEIPRTILDVPETRTFLTVSVNGIRCLRPSMASTRVLNVCWRTWAADTRSTAIENQDYDSEILGELALPIKIEHTWNPCLLMTKFVVTTDQHIDYLVLGSRDLSEFGFTLHLGYNPRCYIGSLEREYELSPCYSSSEGTSEIATITVEPDGNLDIAELQSQAAIPQEWDEASKQAPSTSTRHKSPFPKGKEAEMKSTAVEETTSLST